jgi:hypothetical protein
MASRAASARARGEGPEQMGSFCTRASYVRIDTFPDGERTLNSANFLPPRAAHCESQTRSARRVHERAERNGFVLNDSMSRARVAQNALVVQQLRPHLWRSFAAYCTSERAEQGVARSRTSLFSEVLRF